MKNTENRWDLSVSEKKKSGCTTKSLWRETTILLRKLIEDKIQSIRLSRPDYAVAKRDCQRLQDEHTAETKHLYRPIHLSKQMRQTPNSNLKEVKTTIRLLIGKQDGNCAKSSRETCRILRLRRPHHVRIPYCNIGIHGCGILRSLTKGSE